MVTETLIEDDRWKAVELESLAEQACLATLTHLGVDSTLCEVALLACSDAKIAGLNADFRGKPQPTNVLSWPEVDLSPDEEGATPFAPELGTADDPEHLGDIALAYETCMAEADAQSKTPEAHLTHLIVHGVLHLLGYDHISDADATLMEGIEVEILGKLGLPNPYNQDGARESVV